MNSFNSGTDFMNSASFDSCRDSGYENVLRRRTLFSFFDDKKIDLKTPPRSKKSVNYIEECNTYMFATKQKYEIKKFAILNLVIIILLSTCDTCVVYEENVITSGIKAIVVLICSCNLLHFLISYISLFRKTQSQTARMMELFSKKEPEKVEDLPLVETSNIVTSDAPKTPPIEKREDKSLECSPNSYNSHTLKKYKNKMFSQVHDLFKYMCDYKQAQKDEVVSMSRDSCTPSGPFEFWAAENRKDTSPNSMDVSPLLRAPQYQMSYSVRPNISPSNYVWSGSDFDSELWNMYHVDSAFFVRWICNLRSWLVETILQRLVVEIETANTGLQKQGMGTYLVGTVGIDTLINTANNNVIAHNIPSLTFLVPFLEISTNQQYVVQRIRDLAKGSSMSCYNWRGGGNYNDKPWELHLPTDAELVMHLFLTYLDSRLPLLPDSPTGKPFSSQYFSKSPKLPPKRDLAILQESSTPPHYQLVIKNEIRDIPQGRNNLFCTLVQYLHYVKKNEHGMVGNINWGRAGLNMLWIIENTKI